ncbi:MAG: CDP-alcohol phosphatidyltransferase family protein [Promethearchaeota archaeon]
MPDYNFYYGISLIIVTIVFLIYTYLKRAKISNILTFREYFSKWQISHDQPDKPPEEVPGPLVPYSKMVYNFSKNFAKFGFTPNKMTIFNFLIGFYAILFFALGGNFVYFAALSILFSGILDSVDGCIAGITNNETEFGAYFDAVIDKFGDIVWMIGPILYLLTYSEVYGPFFSNVFGPIGALLKIVDFTGNYHFKLFAVLGLLTIGTTIIQEYCRARQQGLGLDKTIMTLGERPWRVFVMSLLIGILGGAFLTFNISIFREGQLYINNIWYILWLVPLMFVILFAFSIISIIQLTIHGKKYLDKGE